MVRYGMRTATDILLSGSSSGGMAALMQADFVRSLLPASVGRFGVIEDGGWYLPSPDVDNNGWTDKMRSMYTIYTVSTGILRACFCLWHNYEPLVPFDKIHPYFDLHCTHACL